MGEFILPSGLDINHLLITVIIVKTFIFLLLFSFRWIFLIFFRPSILANWRKLFNAKNVCTHNVCVNLFGWNENYKIVKFNDNTVTTNLNIHGLFFLRFKWTFWKISIAYTHGAAEGYRNTEINPIHFGNWYGLFFIWYMMSNQVNMIK